MTPCDLARLSLVARLDGELPDADAARLDAHLADCADCRRERAELTAALGVADAWQVPPPPERASADAARRAGEAEPLPALLAELRALRGEVTELRAEIAALRRENARNAVPPTATVTRQTARPEPPELLPYAPPVAADLFAR